ncbi:hypothetical protein [Botrimarina hoheduenensis]|uniref:Uncharacterized protein n=1 Tax=Botrimarina hoheduenensis TaxID=2528000 RepID=A0A5C5VXQ5_9BACT|nr:hypothetical protein [Botrimarina hoheduenensis]TWT42917.1 hypothetical protein Pla111_25550 [Botrimarina hoheduenensis]
MPAIDFPIRRFTRRCAVSDRALAPGEAYYSVIVEEAGDVVRRDVASDSWSSPPANALGWWRATVPLTAGTGQPAPNEVLLRLLHQWENEPHRHELRYLLALLLLRRRVLRMGDGLQLFQPDDEDTAEPTAALSLTGPGGVRYRIDARAPSAERRDDVKEQLMAIVYGTGAKPA